MLAQEWGFINCVDEFTLCNQRQTKIESIYYITQIAVIMRADYAME